MLFISIMLIVWFGFWLYFTYQMYKMQAAMCFILMDAFGEDMDDNPDKEEPDED